MKISYKGKGEHSINELELIIQQQNEELHLIKSNQSNFNLPENFGEMCDKMFGGK